jgi:hypothetical protein
MASYVEKPKRMGGDFARVYIKDKPILRVRKRRDNKFNLLLPKGQIMMSGLSKDELEVKLVGANKRCYRNEYGVELD